MYFALKRYVTKQFIQYLDAIFRALKDERIKALDMEGTIIKLDQNVMVTTFDKWKYRQVPAITVDMPSGDIEFGSIDKGFSSEERSDTNPASHIFVYPAGLSMDFTGYGRTIEERDAIVDLIAFFLSRFDIFDFFQKRNIRIASPPRISGFGEEIPTGQDFSIYYGTITLGLNVECIVTEQRDVPTIEDIIIEVEDPIKI